MAKSTNQKLKLLYLMQIMLENTDDEHGLSMAEIIDKLAAYDISAERKSIYSDFELLRFYGIDIQREQRDRTVYYYVGARELELAELKNIIIYSSSVQNSILNRSKIIVNDNNFTGFLRSFCSATHSKSYICTFQSR